MVFPDLLILTEFHSGYSGYIRAFPKHKVAK